MTTDTLLAQSAIDQLTSGAHTLVVEGSSYRERERTRCCSRDWRSAILSNTPRWSHARDNTMVLSP